MSTIKNQVVKSVCAVLCTASLCVSALSVTDKLCDMKKQTAELSVSSSVNSNGTSVSVNGGADYQSDSSNPDAGEIDSGIAADTPSADASSESTSQAGTDTPASSAEKPAATGSQVPSTKAEIITYCNTALNKVKTAKPGYSKKHVMNVQGQATGVIDKLKGLVTKNESSTVNKGDDSTDIFPAAGFPYSSRLRESDVESAVLKQNGQYYEITLKLGKEKNPGKGETSSYGRVMSVIDAKDASEMLKGIKSIDMTYHDGYVYAKIDTKTGNVVKAEFSASCDLEASIAVLGDISVKDIVSTETFTDFKW